MKLRCDIFCAVVDNLGDAGVCWRLARRLARERGWSIRLWIDDVAPLAALRPGIDPTLTEQDVDGVSIRQWRQPFPDLEPGAVVIEAFACALPANFVAAMARMPRPPVWINLEYLSAEDWVAGCHGLASPHPTLPLTKHFFFPGFTSGSGGLMRERDADFGAAARGSELTVSLFCYDNPALPRLLDTWAQGGEPIACLVADGLPRRQVAAWCGDAFAVGTEFVRGALRLAAVPFVAQPEYDRRLGSCDLNFVRGEDSFVRAQWAQRPFVWQIYPQDDDVHHKKLDAFLAPYTAELDSASAQALRAFWRAWNGDGDAAAAWPAFRAVLPALAAHAPRWAASAAAPGELVDNLAYFCEQRI
ncbi:MAG: elongation factor P maturation arginine rhamnosyltransferase EarP [Rhodocyclales bacterium]|nr:elongation factor P maturation arginine rhamnosyltransferase EarP [Rhodocyclales bacterium]